MGGTAAYIAFREVPNERGDLVLELLVDGKCSAAARVSAEALDNLSTCLAMTRAEIRSALETALGDIPAAASSLASPLRLVSSTKLGTSYIVVQAKEVVMGCVWYDLESNSIGPDDAPLEVQEELRLAVAQRLISSSGNRALLESFLRWSASTAGQSDPPLSFGNVQEDD